MVKSSILKNYTYFFSKLGIALLIFMLCRILFLVLNAQYFNEISWLNIWGGLRYDWITINILYLPFLLSLIIDFRPKSTIRKILFHLSNTLAIGFNCLDFEYFKFTMKRTTADLFFTSGLENDIFNLLPSFLKDYWYVILLAVGLVILSEFLYRKTEISTLKAPKLLSYLLYSFSMIVITAIGFRGGLQFRPLNVIQASQYAQASNIPIVLNTPYTIIKTIYKDQIEVKTYFESEAELSKIYNPIQGLRSDTSFKPLNVVLIIAESFSKEYIGNYNQGEGYTPFLDSLMDQSLVFENAFANGKKSIEALPSILAGIPTLMNTSYISGNYSSNKIKAIGHILDEKGYQSSFFHGGENGTMGFESFSNIAGINQYYGRDQYVGKAEDYDGKWGIFDEPFLKFTAEELKRKESPFFASIFTLSSHHPFKVPQQYESKFPEGDLPILKSVGYADYALKTFFDTIKSEPWFENTLFVITADHTSQSSREEYRNPLGVYRIPLIFYSPSLIEAERRIEIVQQNDILPSILDFLNWEGEIVSFGESVFKPNRTNFSVSYINGIYTLIQGDYLLHFDGSQSIALYNWKLDQSCHQNLLETESNKVKDLETFLKGIIQQYQSRIIQNNLIP